MRRRCDFATLPMPELRLYHSPKKCAKFLRRHGIEFDPIDNADAQTWTFRDDGESYAVVLYGSGTEHDFAREMGLLAHEATHVALFAFGEFGEENPAEEEMCYVIQAICTWLCEAHLAWKAKRLGVE